MEKKMILQLWFQQHLYEWKFDSLKYQTQILKFIFAKFQTMDRFSQEKVKVTRLLFERRLPKPTATIIVILQIFRSCINNFAIKKITNKEFYAKTAEVFAKTWPKFSVSIPSHK